MAAVVVGIPERHAAGVDRRGQKPEERVGLVLGVPGHDGVGHDPLAGGDQPTPGRWPPRQSPDSAVDRTSTLLRQAERQAEDRARAPLRKLPKAAACHPLSFLHFPGDDASPYTAPPQSLDASRHATLQGVLPPCFECGSNPSHFAGAAKVCERTVLTSAGACAGHVLRRPMSSSDFISCDPALDSTLSHCPPSVSLTVESRGGRHGRKRLQDHRNRRHQPHVLGEGRGRGRTSAHPRRCGTCALRR